MSKLYLFTRSDSDGHNIVTKIKADDGKQLLEKIKENYNNKIDNLVYSYLFSIMRNGEYIEFADEHKLFTDIKDKNKRFWKVKEYVGTLLKTPDNFTKRQVFFNTYYKKFLSWFPFEYTLEGQGDERESFDYNSIDND